MQELVLEWPHWVYIGLLAINLLGNTIPDSRPSSQRIGALLGTGFTVWLLYMGGFWTAGQ